MQIKDSCRDGLAGIIIHWRQISQLLVGIYFSISAVLLPYVVAWFHCWVDWIDPGADANYQLTSCGNEHTCNNVPWGTQSLLASTWTGPAEHLRSRCWTPGALDHIFLWNIRCSFVFISNCDPADNFIFARALDGYGKLQPSWYWYWYLYLYFLITSSSYAVKARSECRFHGFLTELSLISLSKSFQYHLLDCTY